MLTKNDFYKISEFGTFLQGKLIIENKLHLNFGGRYDRQLVRSSEGYEIFQPRLGIVLTSDKLTIKTNYSKGFQNVSLYNKFSTGGNRIPNPSLKPEEIQYLDASVLGSSENQKFKWNFTSFVYDVKNAIYSRVTDLGFNQNVNETDYVALGAMLNFKYRNKFIRVDLNSTFIDAYEGDLSPLEVLSQEFSSEEEVQEKRVGDLAQFRLNFGLTTFLNNDFFQSSFNIRANYVGKKQVGETTTQFLNFGLNQSNIIPEYLVLNSNFIFGFNKLPSIKFAFSLNNILNKLYYHPGIRSASGKFDLNLRNEGESYNEWITRSLSGKLVPYAIQRGRHFNFKILMDL